MCSCQLYEPITPPHLNAPCPTSIGLREARVYGTYREAVRLAWSAPRTDSIGIRSYTLLRKTNGDSAFDVFTRSQGIPPEIDTFYDDLTPIGFPASGFTLVEYRIFALDSLGRTSDTSEACSLYLANQPVLDTIDREQWSLRWHSQYIQGSVSSFVKVWNNDRSVQWSSAPAEEFGSWDFPVYFNASVPDSLRPPAQGVWYFSLYLFAMGTERQSLKVDSFYVN